MKTTLIAMPGLVALLCAPLAVGQITFYEQEGFRGHTYTVDRATPNFEYYGFNDRASSAIVQSGRWEVCEDAEFRGRCTILSPGQYPSLGVMSLNNRISSVRRAPNEVRSTYVPPPPPPAPLYDYYPRAGEPLYLANVTHVRVVTGPPEQRCWVEQQQVRTDPNIGGAIVGGILGGVLGHQIGGGRGQDVATAVGAVGGAAVGANVNRGGGYTQDVQKCATVPSSQPSYWDVTYVFNGRQFRAQLSYPPGPTITVNAQGIPRA
jgi:uncharacterized protein YcfJ